MKHTPGPWHTDKGKSFYVFAHGSLMEQAGVENGPFICNASCEDNARLIAAAPEVLEAIELIHGYAVAAMMSNTLGRATKLEQIRVLSAAVIAKAEGC
jgi:hypothetical protein